MILMVAKEFSYYLDLSLNQPKCCYIACNCKVKNFFKSCESQCGSASPQCTPCKECLKGIHSKVDLEVFCSLQGMFEGNPFQMSTWRSFAVVVVVVVVAGGCGGGGAYWGNDHTSKEHN